jgi:hypothetical protein
MKLRRRPRDLAALLLGVLCLGLAAAAVLDFFVGFAAAIIPVAVPLILIALAVLALLGLRR